MSINMHATTFSYRNQSYVSKTENNISPVSPLDNILKNKLYTESLHLKFYNVFTGDELNSTLRIDSLYDEFILNNNNKTYKTTDHLIYSIEVNGVVFLYASLDNSVRSNMNGHPFAHTRLPTFANVISKILTNTGKECVVFMSESCRSSFYGHPTEKTDEVTWLEMRKSLLNLTGLSFLTENRNNNDFSGMSFGVSVWTTYGADKFIDKYYSQNILVGFGFGSGTVGVRLKTGEIVWGVHFPLDFKNIGEENNNYKTMKQLQDVMYSYAGSVCAIGDMNTIPGNIDGYIRDAITDDYELMLNGVNTFFGSFYDTIDMEREGDNVVWNQLIDQPDSVKYKMLEYVSCANVHTH